MSERRTRGRTWTADRKDEAEAELKAAAHEATEARAALAAARDRAAAAERRLASAIRIVAIVATRPPARGLPSEPFYFERHRAIRKMLAQGASIEAIAERWGVCPAMVFRELKLNRVRKWKVA